jgi:protein required for attachment to host cells
MTYPAYTAQRNRPTAREWVLIANSARARLFERDAENGAMRELAAFVQPSVRARGSTLASDRPGQAMKGAARTQFEPHTDPHEREQRQFAHELAARLEEGAREHRMGALVLIASDPFLGMLRAELGHGARTLPGQHVPRDLTALQGAELEHRVTDVLGTPVEG